MVAFGESELIRQKNQKHHDYVRLFVLLKVFDHVVSSITATEVIRMTLSDNRREKLEKNRSELVRKLECKPYLITRLVEEGIYTQISKQDLEVRAR